MELTAQIASGNRDALEAMRGKLMEYGDTLPAVWDTFI